MSYNIWENRQPSYSVVRKKKGAPVNRQQYSDVLCHFGIKGQKWGIRRFENEDGTLTEEGKERYRKTPESETWKRSEAEHLTDEELRRRNNRLQMERQYRDLTTSQVERERAQRRKDIINKVIIGSAVSLAAVAMRGHWKQAVSFIGKYGKRTLAQIRAKSKLRSTVQNSIYKYRRGNSGLTGYVPMGADIERNFNTHKPSSWIRSFNYRPHTNHAMPKTRPWPSL